MVELRSFLKMIRHQAGRADGHGPMPCRLIAGVLGLAAFMPLYLRCCVAECNQTRAERTRPCRNR
jgi:hypothetical protein